MPYLFSRSAQLARGNVLDARAWSVRITEKVNAISELPVALWASVMSPDTGRLTWTARADDLASIMAMQDKLLADDGYVDLVEEGARLGSDDGVVDALVRLVHSDSDAVAAAPSAQFSTVVRAVLAPGAFVSGTALGVEIAVRAKSITGRPTSFGSWQTGTYGEVGWVSLYDSIDQVQAANEALAEDADFGTLLDDNAGTWIHGTSTQVINRRIV